MRFENFKSLIICTLLPIIGLNSQAGLARDIRLFIGPGIFSPNYSQEVASLAFGDKLTFSNGREFTIDRLLGKGGTSLIYLAKNQNGKAVALRVANGFRLMKSSFGYSFQPIPESEYIAAYINGYSVYKAGGVPLPEIKVDLSNSEYVEGEVIDVKFNLAQALNLDFPMEHPDMRGRSLGRPLDDFAAHLGQFAKIGDFKIDAIVFDGSKWILLDWTDSFVLRSEEFGIPIPDEVSTIKNPAIRLNDFRARFFGAMNSIQPDSATLTPANPIVRNVRNNLSIRLRILLDIENQGKCSADLVPREHQTPHSATFSHEMENE
jgi:hypothetical protein